MKNKGTAAALCFFLGGIGAHKFYLNQPGSGIMYFLFCWTFIPLCFSIVELINILAMSDDMFNYKFNNMDK